MDQVGGQRRQSVILPFRPAILDRRVLTLGYAGFLQALAERCEERLKPVRRRAVEKTDHGHRRLLRVCRNRPRRCRDAEQRDELAAPNHSITSSARASRVAGMSRPSTLAVCRLMRNSNLLARITGSLAGFSPLGMRPA